MPCGIKPVYNIENWLQLILYNNDIMKNSLTKYLLEPRNSHSRESLVNNKLFFDIKLAAAERGYFLNIYTPEVDKDGFDIIFDDQDTLIKVQLKTVMKTANVYQWNIHKSLPRPNMYICEELGFEFSPTGTGYQGGVILIELGTENELTVDYYYTDIIILVGIRDGIIDMVNPPSKEKMDALFKELSDGVSHQKISVHKTMFIKAKSPSSLLALIGLHNTQNMDAWKHHIQKMAEPRDNELSAPYNVLKEHINDDLRTLSESIK